MIEKRHIGATVIMISILISALGGFIVFQSPEGREDITSKIIDTGPANQQLTILTHSSLSTKESMDPEEIEKELGREIPDWFSSTRITLKDYIITVLSVSVDANEIKLSIDLPLPPGNLEGESGTLVRNSMMYGSMGAVPILPGIRTHVDVEVLLEPSIGEGEPFRETISCETEVVDPERGLLELIDLVEKDMNGWGAGMSRDMEYMLNTLTRIRTTNGWGAGTRHSDLNVLNDGDVELAFNIALALRISRWTGYIPEELANDIDAFFLDVTILPETNPTGLRMWGEAEKDNYREIWRVANTPIRRYLPDLISSALGSGHGDPADMFARYLYLERWGNVDDLNMLDMRSPLEDKDLLSNRELSDHNDPYALKHHTSFPDPDGMQVSPRDRYDIDDNQSTLRFEPVIDSQYMIIGRDLFVKGLDSPKAWFTDADPENLKPSDLFAFGGLGTRCGAIPPPAKPPGHDYRLQWDLEITGDMELTASCEGYGGNVLNEGNLRKTISFDIPVRIHTWFDKRPSNDGFQFENINSGRMYWSDLMTGWSISEEANATEIFESKVFKELRPGFELLTSQLRSMEWNIGMGIMDTLNMRKVFQTQTMTLGKQLLTWSQDNLIWTNLDYFWMNHIKATEVQVEDLGTVRTDGHMITFTYSSIKDRLDLVSGLPGGQIRVSIFGVISGTRYIEAGLETSSGIRVDIYPTTGEFSIKGVLDEYYVDDGPLDPDEPSDDIKELIIRSGWIARGPSYDIRTWTTAGPYVEMDTSTMENSLSMSFLIAGENDNDMERIVSEAWGMLDDPGTIGETTSTTHLYEMGAFAVGRGLWFGISARSDGMDRTHPIARDLLIKVSDMGCLDHLVSTGSLGELVRDTIWGATTMDVQDRSMPYGRIDVIMIETVPSWVTSVPLDQGSADLMFVTHSSHINDDQGLRSEQGINLFSYPEPDGRYERGSDGWTSIEIELPTSLW